MGTRTSGQCRLVLQCNRGGGFPETHHPDGTRPVHWPAPAWEHPPVGFRCTAHHPAAQVAKFRPDTSWNCKPGNLLSPCLRTASRIDRVSFCVTAPAVEVGVSGEEPRQALGYLGAVTAAQCRLDHGFCRAVATLRDDPRCVCWSRSPCCHPVSDSEAAVGETAFAGLF